MIAVAVACRRMGFIEGKINNVLEFGNNTHFFSLLIFLPVLLLQKFHSEKVIASFSKKIILFKLRLYKTKIIARIEIIKK